MAGIEIGIHVKFGQFAYAEENVKVNFFVQLSRKVIP